MNTFVTPLVAALIAVLVYWCCVWLKSLHKTRQVTKARKQELSEFEAQVMAMTDFELRQYLAEVEDGFFFQDASKLRLIADELDRRGLSES